MQNAHLNSGKISAFVPIGQDGQPVYRNAEAFVAALNINPQVGPNYTRHLAKPKIAADNDTIDWYIPFNPSHPDGQYRIVTWQAATPQEQEQAREQLRKLEQVLKRVGSELQRRGAEGQSMLFAHYLTGQNSVQQLPAIHFPSQDYVFIVDGVAVITFWGFSANGAPMEQSPFAALHGTGPALGAAGGAGAGAAAVGAGLGAASAQAAPQQPTPEDQGRKKGCLLAWPTLLLGLLLGLLLLGLLWWLLPLLWGWLMSLFAPSVPAPTVGGGTDSVLEAPAPEPEAPLPGSEEAVVPPEELVSGDPTTINLTGPDGNIVLDPNGPQISIDGDPLALTVTEGSGADPLALAGELAPGAAPGMELSGSSGEVPVPDPLASAVPAAEGSGQPADQLAAQPEGASGVGPEGAQPGQGQPSEPSQQSGTALPLDPLANPNALTPEQAQAIAAARAAEAGASASQNGAQSGESAGSAAGSPVPPELTLADEKSLNFSQQALAQQGAAVLNGSWNTRSGLMDSATGTPLQMGYSFEGDKGQVTVTRPDGVKCTAATSAAVAGSGVNITTQGRAVCPDGRTYQMPAVKCEPQSNGTVRCTGHYGEKNFPIQFYAQ